MSTPGAVVHWLKDAKSGLDFPVQFWDDGSGDLIDDVSASQYVALTPDTPAAPGRAILLNCSGAGNVEMKLAGGTTLMLPIEVGITLLPFQIIEIISVGTTATVSCGNIS